MSRYETDLTEKRYLYVTQEVEFCAAHRLYRPELSHQENVALYGKCANTFGHGHNYVLQATFKGELDPQSAMVVDFSKVKRLLEELVVAPLDHHNMNEDVPFLKGVIPTAENVVLILWQQIQDITRSEPWRLMKLKLASSPHHWVEYFGPEFV